MLSGPVSKYDFKKEMWTKDKEVISVSISKNKLVLYNAQTNSKIKNVVKAPTSNFQ